MNTLSSFFYSLTSTLNKIKTTDPLLARLPKDMMIEIFKYLPFEVLAKTSLVSKKWSQLSRDPRLFLPLYCQLNKQLLTLINFSYKANFFRTTKKIEKIGSIYNLFFNKDALSIETSPKKVALNKKGDFQITEMWDTLALPVKKDSIKHYYPAYIKLTVTNKKLNSEEKVIRRSIQFINQRIFFLEVSELYL